MSTPYRIAIIGGGPKALFAVESLCRRLQDHPAARVDLTLIDAADALGEGAAYAATQPAVQLLNVTAGIVDVHEPHAEPRLVPSFQQWVTHAAPERAGEHFPPRAVVGRYLAQAWQMVLAALPDTVRAEHLQTEATHVEFSAEGWRVHCVDGHVVGPLDELLLAVGHARERPDALARTWSAPVPLLSDTAAVPPGSRVAIRGAALTFLDTVLTLTQGRGGVFVENPHGSESGLRYLPSGAEPAAIVPVSRSGLFLDAKPDPARTLPAVEQRAIERAHAQVREVESLDDLMGIVQECAVQILAADGAGVNDGAGGPARAVAATLRTGHEPDIVRAGRAREALRRSVATARGLRDPGPAWALGRAWSGLYADIVGRVSFHKTAPDQWERFARAAAVLERFAFGPPLQTARRLLALIDAGLVDTRALDTGARIEDEHLAADAVLDAVIAPPGALAHPLLQRLIDSGHLHCAPGRRGVMVQRTGQALRADNTAVPGLSVIGRPTEDWVLGNDTLNRRLHDLPQRWAQRQIQMIKERITP